jgi:3,4-dihydroxy 2-butanone 4-phosphate synthase / GTP cyclohydrolase II
MTNSDLTHRVNAALETLRQGRWLILLDDDREQEGDLMFAADKVTPEAINFMAKYGRGIICLALADEIVNRLQLPLMPTRNSHAHQANFTVTIDAVQGISSGTSAYDRCQTVRVAVDPASTPADISLPGHVFPLRAHPNGLLARAGHTEASVELASMAGLQAAAVICEIMSDDGSMAALPELQEFARQHGIPLLSVNDIKRYRLLNENLAQPVS